MGKAAKRSRLAKLRKKGLYSRSVQGSKDDKLQNGLRDDELREKKVLPLVAKLQSESSQDRHLAISSINLLAEDPKLRTLFMKERVVQIVLENLLSDTDNEIVVEAWGFLRNLVIEQGYETAAFLHRQNIFTNITSVLDKSSSYLSEFAEGGTAAFTKSQLLVIYGLTENVIGLLSAMSVTNETLFNSIYKQYGEGLAQFLSATLEYGKKGDFEAPLNIPLSFFNVVSETLYTLSEDNDSFFSKLPQSLFSTIDDIVDEPSFPVSARTYLNGFRYNQWLESQDEDVLPILKSLVSVLHHADLDEIFTPSTNTDASITRSIVDAIQLGIDLIASISEQVSGTIKSGDIGDVPDDLVENEDEDMEEDEIIIHKVVEESHIDIDVETVEIDQNGSQLDSVQYLQTTVLPLLDRLAQSSPFRLQALSAINNICWTLCANDIEWKETASKLWTALLPAAIESKDISADISLLGTLWASAKTLGNLVVIDLESVKNFITKSVTVQSGSEKETDKILFIENSVGLLGVLASRQGHVDITNTITEYIFSLLQKLPDLNASVMVEALNAIYDIFADGSYDYDTPVFVQNKRLAELVHLVPRARQCARRVDRKKETQLRKRADETVINLMRFIDYKKSERI